jgi:hypothetical protein
MTRIAAPAARVQIVVLYDDGALHYYPVKTSWRIDVTKRCIVIGSMPRVYVPFDHIRDFSIEKLSTEE